MTGFTSLVRIAQSYTDQERDRQGLQISMEENVRVTYICPLRLVTYIRPTANLHLSSKRHTLSTVVSQPDISGVDGGFSLERQPWTIDWIKIMVLALNRVWNVRL